MESFRSNATVVRINVNDDGYCVELPVANDVWIKTFADFLTDAKRKAGERQAAISNTDDDMEKIDQLIGFDEDIKAGFGKVFGEDAYKEIFGSDLVGVEYVIEFLEACMPYVEKRVEHRNKAFEKYSPDKTGGVR